MECGSSGEYLREQVEAWEVIIREYIRELKGKSSSHI